MTRIDDLIRRLLPGLEMPDGITPKQLLDNHMVPPTGVAEEVEALRALVRTGGSEEPLTGRIITSDDVAEYFTPRLAIERVEIVVAVGLDARNRARSIHEVGRGDTTSCAISPASVFRPLLLNAAVSTIIVHNHPSGDPTPSPEDRDLTRRMKAASEVIGIRLLDHVVVAREGHYSFLDHGLL